MVILVDETTQSSAGDVNEAGELFTNGCCRGSSPTSFYWLRRVR